MMLRPMTKSDPPRLCRALLGAGGHQNEVWEQDAQDQRSPVLQEDDEVGPQERREDQADAGSAAMVAH